MRTDPHDLAAIEPGEVVAAYDDRGLDRLSDVELVGRCASVIDVPKLAPPDSFVLHAPLELMARAALVGRVDPSARRQARLRLVWLMATYAAAGPSVDDPARGAFIDRHEAAAALAATVAAGDLDGAESAAAWLADHVSVLDLVSTFVDTVAPSLAGAAHGGIFLHQLLSFAPAPDAPGAPGARAFARELARNPGWTLGWFAGRDAGRAPCPTSTDELTEVLRRPPSPSPLDNNFIFPTMHLTESSGLAADLLAPALEGVDRAAATRALLRLAAHSMLQDDPDQAPYGWSHCFTMPHGLLAVAPTASRPDGALAVAATYVLGFRATQGNVDVDPTWQPERLSTPDPLGALDGKPDEAAAAVWHVPRERWPDLVATLVSYAAAHPDAHLAKYTLACLQQASTDPAMAHLYLAAAAFLGAWWRGRPVADDPLL